MTTQNFTRDYPVAEDSYDTNNHWYYPPSCGGSDFASVMHNKWGYPKVIEKEAITKCSKLYNSKEDMANSVYKYLYKYFGNRHENERVGLVTQYIKLKTNVIDNKVIGVILWAADINNLDREISEYTTSTNTKIILMTYTICQKLIDEYIDPENVDRLCKLSLD